MPRLPLKPYSEEDFKTALLRETVVSHQDPYLSGTHPCDLGFPNAMHSKANGKQSFSDSDWKS